MKPTDEEIDKMLKLRLEGYSYRLIAKLFEITGSRVYQLLYDLVPHEPKVVIDRPRIIREGFENYIIYNGFTVISGFKSRKEAEEFKSKVK